MAPLPDDFSHLSIPERIALAQALWDSIEPRNHVPSISEARRAELERRAAEDDAFPEDVVSWEQVKADILSRLRQR